MVAQDHCYGDSVFLVGDAPHLALLGQFCGSKTKGRQLYFLLEELYRKLFYEALSICAPFEDREIPTRMSQIDDSIRLSTPTLGSDANFVVVDLARAGTSPSDLIYRTLLGFDCLSNSEQERVRQDHIFLNRKTDEQQRVTGVSENGLKIGGDSAGKIILVPDPMGATGQTMGHAYQLYSQLGQKKAFRNFVALHLIVTPEYLKFMKENCPRAKIVALRLDRGLSDKSVLEQKPGKFWSEEKGLTEQGYIVPGAGGIGEILNNCFV